MNIKSVFYLNLFLAGIGKVSVNGLQCIKCEYNKDQDTCSDLSKFEKTPCKDDEVCFKALLYEDIKRPESDMGKKPIKVYRGCRRRDLNADDNDCAFQKFEPSDGWICSCSDKDYCNGVESVRNVNLFISRHYLVLFIALSICWISWSI